MRQRNTSREASGKARIPEPPAAVDEDLGAGDVGEHELPQQLPGMYDWNGDEPTRPLPGMYDWDGGLQLDLEGAR